MWVCECVGVCGCVSVCVCKFVCVSGGRGTKIKKDEGSSGNEKCETSEPTTRLTTEVRTKLGQR